MKAILKLSFVAILFFQCMQANGGIITGPITNPANGHSYCLLDTNGYKWWLAAESEAVSLGGHLVTINNAAENQWVLNTFSSSAINYANAHSLPDRGNISFWIGLSDYQQSGKWVWVSGETPTYTNWYPGQPEDWKSDDDFCGMLVNWWNPGQWHDLTWGTWAADLPFGVVEVVPEPATLLLLGLGGLALRIRKK